MNFPRGSYRGKVCAQRLVVTAGSNNPLLTFNGCKQHAPAIEVETTLPDGRPAMLRFCGNERSFLFAVFVPKVALVKDPASHRRDRRAR